VLENSSLVKQLGTVQGTRPLLVQAQVRHKLS